MFSAQISRNSFGSAGAGTPRSSCGQRGAHGAFLEAQRLGQANQPVVAQDGGEAEWLSASGSVLTDPAIADLGDFDSTAVTIRTKKGRLCQINTSRRAAYGYDQRFEVIGTAGKLQIGEHAARDRVVRSDAAGVAHAVTGDFHERFEMAFAHEMAAFVAACRGVVPLSFTLADAMEAMRIGLAVTRSLHSGMPEVV